MTRLASMLFGSLAVLLSWSAWADLIYKEIDGYGGVPLNVIETGNRNGPGILFIHGFGQASEDSTGKGAREKSGPSRLKTCSDTPEAKGNAETLFPV